MSHLFSGIWLRSMTVPVVTVKSCFTVGFSPSGRGARLPGECRAIHTGSRKLTRPTGFGPEEIRTWCDVRSANCR
jgi:hypothetical protein